MRGRRNSSRARRVALLIGFVVPFVLATAARAGDPDTAEHDPLERFNRAMFWFNDRVDGYVLEPTARGWKQITPEPVRTSVSNFFTNLQTPITAVNDLLQGKGLAGATDVGRFGVNTTVGVVGLFDPASRWGLEKHYEDFGQTLGVWRVPPGPYLVLPLFGPSNIRDTVGLGVDSALTVYPFFVEGYYTLIPVGARALDIVNYRSTVLDQVDDAKRTALDYYVFVRNAYVQRRDALVHDRADTTAEDGQNLYHPDIEGAP